MSISGLFILTLMMTYKPIVLDSIIYAVDIYKMEVKEQSVSGTIIDYCIDDFLYVLTNRALYKIDSELLAIDDRIPLPQRFNYLAINNENIILITTDEIIIIDKNNLAFKRGIGIERGDYRPIITHRRLTTSKKDNVIYLIADSGRKSIMKIFDLNSGRLKRKVSVDRILFYDYNAENNTLVTLDIKNRLVVYDMYLKKIESLDLEFSGKWFSRYDNAYIVYSEHGIFSVNRFGKLIDFQPITIDDNSVYDKFTLLTENGIVFLDSLTLRPKGFFKNDQMIKELLQIQSNQAQYAIVLDTHYHFRAIDINTMEMMSMVEKKVAFQEIVAPTVLTDSLWYFQLGAFALYDNAIEKYNNIKHNNIPVFIDSTNLYRIKFGGFQDKISAINIIEKIDLNGWLVFQEKYEQEDIVEFYVDSEKYILRDGIIKRSGYEENN